MSDGLKFFGCTVKAFGTTLGWGSQPSSVRITLVQDVQGGDLFAPIPIGTPATVEYGSLHFTGLLRDWRRQDSTDGFPVYDVNLEDPRSILDGAEIILRDYNGFTYSVPNLLNVYGYFENFGFGNALVNDSGMPWYLIQDGIQAIVDGSPGSFGGPLTYKGVSYGIDLSHMPEVPSYYRVPGTNISLLKVIEQVCSDAACDFFIDFIPGTSIIRVRVTNRRLPPSLSVLSSYIDAQTLSGLCISSSKGLEMRNEPTSAFITGGLQSTLFASTVNYQYFGQNILNQPIVTYYQNPVNTLATGSPVGAAVADNLLRLAVGSSAVDDYYAGAYVVITSGTGAGQQRSIVAYTGVNRIAEVDRDFITTPDATSVYKIYTLTDPYGIKADLNCSPIADIIGSNTYTCYMTEMLCALHDITTWETYVQANRGDLSATFEGWRLPIAQQIGALVRAQMPMDVVNLRRNIAVFQGENVNSKDGEWKKRRIYDWLISTVNNHLGKTFLAQIPFMLSTVEADTLRVVYSHEPSNAGWVEGGAPAVPLDKQVLVESEDGRIGSYAQYIKTKNVAARGTTGGFVLTPNDIYLSNASNVDNTYIDYIAEIISGTGVGQTARILTYTGATQVATIDTSLAGWALLPDTSTVYVIYKAVSNLDLSKVGQRGDVIIDNNNIFVKSQVEQGKVYMVNGITPCALVTVSDAIWSLPSSAYGPDTSAMAIAFGHSPAAMEDFTRFQSGGRIIAGCATPPCYPLVIQVPLQSNTLTYGPWVGVGAQGKVSFRSDSSLVPWNYGGQAIMDQAGGAMVNDAISWSNVIESGEVQLVGTPTLNLGDALQGNGPVCTGMDVRYGQDGITTTYRFQTFSPKFGLFSFQNVQRLKSLGLANQRISREIRSNLNNLRSLGRGTQEQTAHAYKTWLDNAGFWSGHSSHPVIICDSRPDIRDSQYRRVETALVSAGEMTHAWGADVDGANSIFTSKASVSLSALIRPAYTRLVGVNAANAAINLPAGVATYADMQMASYWNSTAMANYTYAMTVSGSNSIDPFLDGNDIEVLLKGDTYTDAHNALAGATGQNTQRVVALKGPLVITAWGYCTDDSYVPAANPSTLTGGMLPGYLRKSHLWKTGPLEILWDDERGVWTGMGFCFGKLVGSCAAGGSTTLTLYEDRNTAIPNRKKNRTVYNVMSRSVAAGTMVACGWCPDRKGWIIISADCT